MSFIKKKKGDFLLYSTGFFALITSIIVVMFAFSVYAINAQNDITKDSLTAANLAVFREIDLKKLGEKNIVVVENPIKAIETYKKHLNYNLKNVKFIIGDVKISKFIIYNVKGNDVYVYDVNTENNSYTEKSVLGGRNNIKTPRGNLVTATTIHSQITFKIQQMFKKEELVQLSEDTDIIKEEKENNE